MVDGRVVLVFRLLLLAAGVGALVWGLDRAVWYQSGPALTDAIGGPVGYREIHSFTGADGRRGVLDETTLVYMQWGVWIVVGATFLVAVTSLLHPSAERFRYWTAVALALGGLTVVVAGGLMIADDDLVRNSNPRGGRDGAGGFSIVIGMLMLTVAVGIWRSRCWIVRTGMVALLLAAKLVHVWSVVDLQDREVYLGEQLVALDYGPKAGALLVPLGLALATVAALIGSPWKHHVRGDEHQAGVANAGEPTNNPTG